MVGFERLENFFHVHRANGPGVRVRIIRRIALVMVLAVLVIAAVGLTVLYVESRAAPDRSGEYVALGSSFAAGPKLGPLVQGSPHACWRTVENYPHQLARATGLHLVDVSCGGSTARNILEGGPFFQRPQIEAIGSSARLVTLTVGGNDVDYIGDLGLLAYRDRDGLLGSLVRLIWKGPHPADARPFDALVTGLVDIVALVHKRSPQAIVVLVTYPQVLPLSGTCASIGISEDEASLMREVASRLAQATRTAASRSSALLVDMAGESAGHDACSRDPWVNGSAPSNGAMFHPNLTGTRATALMLEQLVRGLQSQGRL
jgi:lysophospholipase L1-like esterase